MDQKNEEACLSQVEELYYLPNSLAKNRGKDFAADFQYFMAKFDKLQVNSCSHSQIQLYLKKIPSFFEFKAAWKEAHLHYVHTVLFPRLNLL